MTERIFITGGTGTVGKEIASLLLQKTDSDIHLLVHDKGAIDDKETILKSLFSLPAKKEFVKRLNIIKGDITQPNIGLSAVDYKELSNNITHIIHAAASTRFDLPIQEARNINVIGAENVVKLACDCSDIRKFGFISTIYVSGKRTGKIRENDLEHNAGFVNTYEQSKYEAELMLSNFAKKIPTTVYRLSAVIGDSETGKVNHFTAPHQAIRMMYLGLAAMLPGTTDYLVDLISSNYTAYTIFRLYWEKFAPNRIFHITNGEGSFTLEEIIDESYKQLALADPEWSKRNYPKPVIVTADAFDLFMHSAIAADNTVLQKTLNALNHFAHQLIYPKEFDQTELFATLPNYVKELPDIKTYYGKVIRYCVNTKWGKLQ